jgi:hypothetical protein
MHTFPNLYRLYLTITYMQHTNDVFHLLVISF